MTAQTAAPLWQEQRPVSLLGMGVALPGEPLPTAELLERLRTRFQVDVRRQAKVALDRLRIHTRHVCRDFAHRHEAPRPGDTNAQLAARALRAALDESRVAPHELSYLIAHTTTPGALLPPNVAQVAELVAYAGPVAELRQACAGFANALAFAIGLLHAPDCGPVAIVGSETGSVFFDPMRAVEDPGQLVNLLQMGDGAAACVLGTPSRTASAQVSHLFHGRLACGYPPAFTLRVGGSDLGPAPRLVEFEHDYASVPEGGAEIFREAFAAAARAGINPTTVSYFIPHQVSGRIGAQLASHLGIEERLIFVNAQRFGNTGSAAVWLALAELRRNLRSGDSVCVLGAEATAQLFGGFLYVH
ncbi:MAG: 3-oxoacyl-ACP synthase [Gammaproteobacteria bacterium]|nr:3-oxoacyl-ACP synthase [Gammaproteobacteria bacterium]